MSDVKVLIERELRGVKGGTKTLYRAEMWRRPYCGAMLAATRWVKTKRAAKNDAVFIFGYYTKDN